MSDVFEYLDAYNNYFSAEDRGDIVSMANSISRIRNNKPNLEDIVLKPRKKSRGMLFTLMAAIIPAIAGVASAGHQYDLPDRCNFEDFSESYLNSSEDYDSLNLIRRDSIKQLGWEPVWTELNISLTSEDLEYDDRALKYSLMYLASEDVPQFGELNSESEMYIRKYIGDEVETTTVPIKECYEKEVIYNSPLLPAAAFTFALGSGLYVGYQLDRKKE